MFDPADVVVLHRDDEGLLTSSPVALPADFKPKRYRDNRRQFAEAVLARAVLVVEGSTEGALLSAVAEVLAENTSVDYVHPDVAGLTLFDAQSDVAVPLYAPIFRSLGKRLYGVHDTPKAPISSVLQAKASEFTHRVIPYLGVEELLAAEIPMDVQRRFLVLRRPRR